MGLAEIAAAFERARAQGRPALMPYWSLGYPDAETSLRVIQAIADAGADLIELGVPFSDPLADGPVIQQANQIALDRGITLSRCFEIAARARACGITTPFLAMGYANPTLAYGQPRYAATWAQVGADGLIVPDLPPEESGTLAQACAENGLALVQFTAPTSTEARIRLAAAHATGFIYVVSVAGVTGPRESLAEGLRDYVMRVKAFAQDKPVVVGFGISTPEHVRTVGEFADGVIVASALLRYAGQAPDPARAAFEFVRKLQYWI
ncbi:MAG: tryptophan synthase subunit alpha [Anaerolineae bacterium]|nr:tryptophan synthase subunit alpha [Thermoflexales bacterium]MDW8396524.1 tryptophan synthase subunit alpha [Anaerolineae bacterium]